MENSVSKKCQIILKVGLKKIIIILNILKY